MTSNFPQVKVKYQATDQEFPKTTNRINGQKKKKTLHLGISFSNYKKNWRWKFLKRSQRRGKTYYLYSNKGKSYIQILFRSHAKKKRMSQIFKVLREKKIPTKILYSMKLFFK